MVCQYRWYALNDYFMKEGFTVYVYDKDDRNRRWSFFDDLLWRGGKPVLLTIGMVNELYIESGNDTCQSSFRVLANQNDYDAF